MIQLHPQLAKDCHQLGKLTDSILLLHKNSSIPWFILVPQTQLTDLLDLPTEQRNCVIEECSLISRFVRKRFGSPKINFGAIGNLVPQMHLHVIGRTPGDACWPQPVWGNLKPFDSYGENELLQIIEALKAGYGLNAE